MTTKKILCLAVPAALLIAGCGSSSSDDAPDSASSSPATTAGAPSAEPATTEVANGKVTVGSTEYAFQPGAINAKAGKVAVTLDNKGAIPHELVVLKTDAAPDALKVGEDQRVSEKTSVGEVSEISGGKTKTSTLDLKAGRYIYLCNIPTHYAEGMRGVLTVK